MSRVDIPHPAAPLDGLIELSCLVVQQCERELWGHEPWGDLRRLLVGGLCARAIVPSEQCLPTHGERYRTAGHIRRCCRDRSGMSLGKITRKQGDGVFRRLELGPLE